MPISLKVYVSIQKQLNPSGKFSAEKYFSKMWYQKHYSLEFRTTIIMGTVNDLHQKCIYPKRLSWVVIGNYCAISDYVYSLFDII
jgi:hypothetical protein